MASVTMYQQLRAMPDKRDILAAFRKNLDDLVDQKAGGNRKEFSRRAALGETFIRDVIERGTDPRLSSVVQIAQRNGISIDEMLDLPGSKERVRAQDAARIYVVGEVGAGIWREVDDPEKFEYEREESPFPADPRYAADAQFDLIVRGNSINRFARDGERLRCLDIEKSGIDIYDDDIVIVRSSKESGHLIETTAKRVRKRGPLFELLPDSDDPRWQEPIVLDPRKADTATETRIVALVLYTYNPARGQRRR